MSLEGQVAIVTGGGTGIGFGIVELLSEKGVNLVIAQHRLEKAQEAAAALKHTQVLPLGVDIRERGSVESMVASAVAAFGRIDILVNNASVTGSAALAPILDCEIEQVDDIVDVNLKGTFYCSQSVAKQMVAQGRGGNIVHIASVGAYAGQEFASLYCSTKAAQVSLAQTMALELVRYRIRVNCIAPGDIYTDASARINADKNEAGASGRYARKTPLGHRGSPRDIGHAVAYLVSNEAAFVTGSTLLVDGGYLAY